MARMKRANKVEGKNIKALALLRVSSRRQEHNSSHEVQEAEIRGYCAGKGLELIEAIKIVESAADSDSRHKYAQVIKRALKENIPNLLVYTYDRETRNLTDNEANEKLVRSGKLVLHYVRERKILSADSPDTDFFTRDINAATSKQYSRQLGTRIADAMKHKAEAGWLPANHIPLGYMHVRPKNEDGREMRRASTIIIPNPATAPMVKREFELRAQGLSYDDIRKRVLSEGLVPLKKIQSYIKSEVEYRLKNPFYWGKFTWKGVEYQGRHELIIPDDVLAKVQASFGGKRPLRDASPDGVHGLFAGGWLTCAECGCNIVYEPRVKKTAYGAKTYHLYHCTNGKRAHKSLAGMYAHESHLWEQLGGALDAISITPEFAVQIETHLNAALNRARADYTRLLGEYKAQDLAIQAGMDKAYDLLAAGTLDQDTYSRQMDRLKNQRQQLGESLALAKKRADGTAGVKAKTALELASRAKSLWISRPPRDKYLFLKTILSNQRLRGTSIEFDLIKPLAAIAKMREKEGWCAYLDDFITACDQFVA